MNYTGTVIARLALWYATALGVMAGAYWLYALLLCGTSEPAVAAWFVAAGTLASSIVLFPFFALPFVVWVVVAERWGTFDRMRGALVVGTALVSALGVLAGHAYIAFRLDSRPVEIDRLLAHLDFPTPQMTPPVPDASEDFEPLERDLLRMVRGGGGVAEWFALWIGMLAPRLLLRPLAPGTFAGTDEERKGERVRSWSS